MASILVIEDSPSQVTQLKKMLAKHDHETFVAEDGATGVELARQQQPDLILMDVVMPELNGFQATRKLTNDPDTAHIPIIIVTTKDQPTDKVWGERQGAKGFIVKPVVEDELLGMISKLLQ